jgi:hypothetical protein
MVYRQSSATRFLLPTGNRRFIGLEALIVIMLKSNAVIGTVLKPTLLGIAGATSMPD